jgi:predicted CopG family antitoxin
MRERLTAYAFWKLKILEEQYVVSNVARKLIPAKRRGKSRFLTNPIRTPLKNNRHQLKSTAREKKSCFLAAHVSEIPIEDFYVSVDDFESDELVVACAYARDEEERCVSPINDLRIWS